MKEINPCTGNPCIEGSCVDICGNYFNQSPYFRKTFNSVFFEEDEIKLTPEQVAKIRQEIAEEKAKIERRKSKLQKFFERYIHFF